MTERHNIEIDYCPSCRGIWLDKGELDKMLQYVEDKVRTTQPDNQPQQPQQSSQGYQGQQSYQGYQQEQPRPKHQYDDDDYYKNNPNYQRRKKKGFLGDLFDFD